jgi:hypothetical protein
MLKLVCKLAIIKAISCVMILNVFKTVLIRDKALL